MSMTGPRETVGLSDRGRIRIPEGRYPEDAEDSRMDIQWTDGAEITVRTENGAVVLSANREGLLSLAGQFAALAAEKPGSHIHYDAYNSLEEGSAEMTVELTE